MKLITAAIITCNDLIPLQACLKSLQGHVDEYCIGVDDKDTDNTYQWLKSNGYNPYHFTFKGFGRARSENMSRSMTPWALVIDSDETMLESDAKKLRRFAQDGLRLDGYLMPRKFWLDLSMTRPSHENSPPVHRLIRTHAEYSNNVHEICEHMHQVKLVDTPVHSFNLAYYPLGSERWLAKQKFYGELGCKESLSNFQKHGREDG